jgi:AraC family transcriptional regulator of adaptative response / DNA-3-methyladenine glycosylase II
VPGSPAWEGTTSTVRRAVRLIAAGELDAGSVDDLADRLGVGARHLRRLFLRHLGVTPIALAKTRRAHLARKLLEESRLSITEVASSAGYASLRRFHADIRATFHQAPRDLRARVATASSAQRKRAQQSAAGLTLRLPCKAPYDWTAIVEFLGARAVTGVEHVDAGVYRRTVMLDGAPGVLSARWVDALRGAAPAIEVSLSPAPGRALVGAVARAARLFDVAADPARVAELLGRDRALGPMLRAHPGLRVPGAWDGFELAVRAVLGQQVSVAAARTLACRLAARLGVPLAADVSRASTAEQPLRFLFPTAEAVAGADLRGLGLTSAREATLRELASRVARGSIVLDGTGDPDETRLALVDVPGIGAWTAEYIAMRALGEPDAFPASDLGVREALGSLAASGAAADVRPTRRPTAREVEQVAEAWRPFRAYAVMHLWKYCATRSKRAAAE